MQAIKIKRIYDDDTPPKGYRILVDRVWPRGISKEEAKLDEWDKEIAPSTELRKWFDHDDGKWPEFSKKYRAELKSKHENLEKIYQKAKSRPVTLLYGAKNEKHNQAVVLQEVLKEFS